MNKVIGICGAPSSGKTTISQLLRWQIESKTREVPREYARHYMEKYGPISNIHQQLLIYDGQTKLEKQMRDNYELTISDSPRFLSYIYSKKYFNYKNKHEKAALVRIYELSLESLQDYEIIYLLPPPEKIIQDGIREQKDGDGLTIFNDIKIFLETHAPDLFKIIEDHNRNNMMVSVNVILKDLIEKEII